MRVINSGTVSTLSYEGTSGQLFAVSDTFVGTIFSVNDVSGIPSIEVLDSGVVKLAEYNGFVRVGSAVNNENATSVTTGELQVTGGVGVSRDVYVGGAMTVVGTLNAAVIAGSITNAANIGITNDTGSSAAQYLTFVSGTSGNLPLKVDGSELVFVPSTGRIGIGNAAPAYKLDVTGEAQVQNYLRITNTGGAQSLLMGNQDSGGVNNPSIIVAANGTIFFGNGNSWTGAGGSYTYRANISSSGLFLGTGTTSATYPLTIVNASPIMSIGNASNQGGAIYFGNSAHGVQRIGTGNDVSLYTTSGNVYLSANGVATTTHVALLNNGNVGIGDADPTEKLVVAGSAVITGGVYGSEAGAPDARIWAVSPANPTWGIFYNEGTPDYIEFQTAGTVSSRIALDSGAAHFGLSGGGRVGIGTATPNTRLHIFQDGFSSNTVNPLITLDGKFNVTTVDNNDIVAIASRIENNAGGSQTTNIIGSGYQATYNTLLLQPSGGNVGVNNINPGRALDVTGVTNVSSHITQGALISRPNVAWGASGTSTGAVVIKFPGSSGNYGMVHIVIDIYTYDGENASTIIIGGHNWNSAWYNYGASRVGAYSKGVRVAYKDGQYAVVLGTNTSTWSYGQVVVRKIQNGSYYSGVMDLGGTYTIAQDAAAESYTWISSNLITAGSAGGGGWNSGNDGSGSGLDADLIDGLDSTQFLRRDVSNVMFSGQTSALSFENQTTFFRFAFNDLRFYDWNNGTDIFGLDEHAYATTSMRAPIFYDRNDTTYYLDPASTSKAMIVNGNIELTARSESWAEGIRINVPTAGTWGGVRFARGSGTGNWAIGYTGVNSTDDFTVWSGTTNSIQVNLDHSANLSSIGSMRAPIFYDSNDTTYYTNMAGRRDTNINGFSARTKMTLGLTANYQLDRADYTSDTNYWIGSMGWSTTDMNTVFDWGSGFIDSWSNPGNQPSGTSHWVGTQALHYTNVTNRYGWQMVGGPIGNLRFRNAWGGFSSWKTVPILDVNDNNGGAMYAGIYYDASNTAFYTDPASTSVVNNLTVNGTLTYSGTLAAGVDYARRLDNATRTAISVGGNASTFYPVVLQIGAGATNLQYGEFVLERGGYDDPGYTGVNFSTFNMRMTVKASGWGFGSTYENCEALYQNVQLVANWQQVSESSRLIIWLRGATIYYLWNVVGNTTVVNANAAGGNIVESNPPNYTYTFTPTTTVQPKAQHSKYFNNGTMSDGNSRISSLGVGTNASGTDGRIDATADIRAPIYYDSNNTGYYADPTSTSVMSTMRVPGATSGWSLMVGENTTTGIYNDNARYGLAINAPYYPHLYLTATTDNGNTTHGPVISLQGIRTAGGFRKWNIGIPNRNPDELSFGWYDNDSNPHYGVGINWASPASMWIDTGHNLHSRGSMRTPIFYDRDDTSYYLDPNADLSLKVYGEISNSNYVPGNLQPGALNIGRTDRDYGWDSTSWSGDVRAGILANCSELWEFVIHDSGDSVESVFRYNGGDQLLMGRDIGWGTLYIEAASSFRAPIFYDSNNTAYYIDPASTSVLNALTVNSINVGSINAGSHNHDVISHLGRISAETGRSVHRTGVYTFGTYTAANPGGNPPLTYPEIIAWGSGASGSIQLAGDWISTTSTPLRVRSLRDCCQDWSSWSTVATSNESFTNNVDLRAPVFYDSNNTGYYVDPASISVFNGFNLGGTTAYVRYQVNSPGAGYTFSSGGSPAIWLESQSGDFGGLCIDNDGTTVYGAGDNGWVFRVIDEDSYQGVANNAANAALYTCFQVNQSLNGGAYVRGTFDVRSGDIIVGTGQTSSNIYMADTDEGQRRIHCNSNRIGFLNDGNNWGSYCGDGGEWYSDQSVRSPIFYDNNNTGYYADPASSSTFKQLRVASQTQTAVYYDAAIEVREYNYGGAQVDATYNYPRIGFHWGGRVASSIAMSSNGWINIMNNPGTGYENLIAAQGLFTSEVTAYYSDIRLKTRVGTIDNAIEKVKAIETFKYVNNELANSFGFTDTDVHVGVSAQSVEAVLPEIVRHAPFDMKSQDGDTISASGEWYKTVQYDKLVPLLIEAIKEQQTIIEQHRAELDELRELKELLKQSLGK